MSTSSNISKAAGYAGAGLSLLNKAAPSILAGTALASAPVTLGISAIPLAIQELSKIRQGARTAKDFTTKYQKTFQDKILAPLAELKKTDPQGAAQQLASAWSEYLQQANQYAAQNPTAAKVVGQMLNTPELTGTVTDILKPLGVNALDPRFANGATFQSQNKGPSALGAALPLIATAGSQIAGGLSNRQGAPAPTGAVYGPPNNPPGVIPPPPAPTSNPAVDILGKIFGIPAGSDQQSTIDKLVKMGIPLAGAIVNGHAATSAANTQAAAADTAAKLQSDSAANSLDFSKQVYGDQQNQTAPYRAAGVNALSRVQDLLGLNSDNPNAGADSTKALQSMPGYQLNLSEGMKALRSASRGVVSGNTLKAADKFASDYAGNYLDKTLGQLDTVAGLGQNGVAQNNAAGNNAVATNTNVSQNLANNNGELAQQAAQLRTSSYGSGVFSKVLKQLQEQA